MRSPIALFCLVATLASDGAFAADPPQQRPHAVTETREPCADYTPTRKPFFGDTHVHTALSFDANSQDTRNRPADAYAFAKGRKLGIQPYDDGGVALRSIQLDRPLDFTAVSDHAEFLGEIDLCSDEDSASYWNPICLLHRNWPGAGIILFGARGLIMKQRWGLLCGSDDADCLAALRAPWNETRAAAEAAYDRTSACTFTSFVGYEWTASVGSGINLHRNVIFRNEKVPEIPASWIDTPSASDLWNALEANCLEGIAGCDVLMIPHNSNLSGGLIFETADVSEPPPPPHPIRADEAARRSRFEPLVEIMQHKGSSECDARLAVWSNDEVCGFEKLPYDTFGAQRTDVFVAEMAPSAPNFVRHALKDGLRLQGEFGHNPFKYGIIASTDTHIAAPGLVAEKQHPGHGGAGKGGGSKNALEEFPDDFEFGPGGLAVLWAEENTRDALFAAMQRKEAYGTSGTRPSVRFFGGWDYPEDLCSAADFASQGYANGVPMGGDLPARPRVRRAPRFAVSALRDAGTGLDAGSGLQRIEIVKGWSQDGALHERVVEVAGGDNGASVDLASCEAQGKGAAALCAVWEDPDFDPTAPAFYYARVLENPTCRWSQYVCLEAKVDCDDPDSVPEGLRSCCSAEHRPVIQERAWTSPIWYTP